MARDVIVVPNGKGFISEVAREWAEQYVAEIPSVRGSADVGGSSNWITLASTLTTNIILSLTAPATLCFLGGEQKACAPVPGVSAATQTVTLCTANIALDPEIVFYDVPAASGGKSLRAADDEAISKGNAALAQLRRNKRKAFEDIGKALENSKKVMAVELLALDATIDLSIAKQLCAEWKVAVGGYKKPITLDRIDGRARLFFKGDPPDAFVPGGGPGRRPGFLGSNNSKAETDVPPFDKTSAFLFNRESTGMVQQVPWP